VRNDQGGKNDPKSHFTGGAVPSRETIRGLVYSLLALGGLAWCRAPSVAQEILRFTYNVPGDSKAIVLHADEIATWVEGRQRILLLKGKVLLDHGVVQARMQQAVGWIDLDRYRQTGILRIEFYAELDVSLENGTETRSASQALLDISTRGELKLKSQKGKVIQESQPEDPLYKRAREARSPPSKPAPTSAVKQASFQQESPQQQPGGGTGAPAVPVQTPVNPSIAGVPQPTQQPPAPAAPVAPFGQPPPDIGGGLAPPPGNAATAPVPPVRPSQMPVPTPGPPGTGPRSLANTPVREFSILPRTPAGFEPQFFRLSDTESAIVAMGGVILLVRTAEGGGLVDIEADRLVLWTHGNPMEVLNRLRTPQGQSSREMELYLAGNVEIRSQFGKESRTLKAREVYYDVARNVAVAMQADVEFRQPGIPDPVHLKAEELLKLSETLYKGVKAEVFSSRLPSDPGLTVYVAEATVEEKTTIRTSIFGIPFINRQTGQEETVQQRIFDGRNVFLNLEHVPIFYLPILRGDANDPLGPLESINVGYNRIFGAELGAVFNVYDLLGLDPLPLSRWRMDIDYLSQRGPAGGTNFDLASKTFFGLPAQVTETVKANTIWDHGTDQLGGGRGPEDHHPEGRGRFVWKQNVQDLPDGFSVQSQVAAYSDKNYFEQFFKNEFDTEINQSTFLYIKQQQGNWAWTFLTEPQLTFNWVDQTEWLPKAEGYLLGQSFFDLFTYNVRGSAGYGRLLATDVPPPPVEVTIRDASTGRFDLGQELSLPFTLGAFRIVPYGDLDLTYYTEDLTGSDRGRVYGGGGVRGSIPFTRLYPDIQSELWNLNGINHKIVLSGNYYASKSDTPFTRLPQLDMLNDWVTDQALRDIKPVEPSLNPNNGLALKFSPIYDPQIYAIQRLVDNRIDTLDTIDVVQLDLRQRWQTKRGYPGMQHIVDWMTLDVSGSFFPHSQRDNFGNSFAFLEYDWVWNIGDRTALVSSGWVDPYNDGPRVFTFGAYLNRPDRTNFFLGYREIDPLHSEAVTAAVTYIFSPKYAITASATWDFGVDTQINSLTLTRMGTDLQVSLGFSYNSILNNFGVSFEITPNIVPPSKRLPGLAALGPGALGNR
jgi:hypothetical protein